MANQLEDFLITLGFDTSKVTKQIKDVQQSLQQLAVKTDNARVKSGLAAQKQISDNEIKQTKKTAAAKEKIETKADKARIAREKETAKMIGETRRQAALRQLRNQIAEAERNTVGPSNLSQRYKYYEKGRASIAKINAFTEQLRGGNQDTRNRLKAAGLLSSFDSSSAARDQLNMTKAKGSADVTRLRMSQLGLDTSDFDRRISSAGSISDMKQIVAEAKNAIALQKQLMQTQKATIATQLKSAKIQKKAVGPDQGRVADYITGLQASGRIPASLARQIQQGAMQQSTQKGAEQFINQAARAGRYQQMGVRGNADIGSIIAGGNRQALSDLNNQLGAAAAKMAAIERRSIGAAAAMGGMHDSTRNMVRELASVYTMLAATGYIKEQAKAMDGMQAGLVAVTNDAKEADVALTYLKDTILQNGLSVKEAGKDFVKLKAAMGKNAPLQDTIDAYEALARTGVVFQISQDDMTGTIRALGQIKQLKVCHHSNVV